MVDQETCVVPEKFIKNDLFGDWSRAVWWSQKFVFCVKHSSKTTCVGIGPGPLLWDRVFEFCVKHSLKTNCFGYDLGLASI